MGGGVVSNVTPAYPLLFLHLRATLQPLGRGTMNWETF